MNPLQEAVNNYHQQGFCIIPIIANSKRAAVEWAEYQNRRPSVEELRSWFADGSKNVAVVCGEISGGLALLDIDDEHLAARMAGDVGLRAETSLTSTPRNGLHIWCRETEASSRSGPLIPGLADLKSGGGYAVLPPSIIEGREYRILTNKNILAVPNAREWATGLLRAYEREVPDERHEPLNIAQAVDEMHEGNRNDSLFRILSKLRGTGLRKEELETFAYQTGRGAGLEDREIETILRSVLRYPAGETQALPPATTPSVKAREWPEPAAEEAFSGLAGDIVRALEPNTEADPHALLADIMTTFGVLIGNGPHFLVGRDRHEMRLNVVIVGPTGHGRKGLSHAESLGVYKRAVPDIYERTTTGLSSGEGLIHAVHDPIFRREPIKERGRVVEYQDVEVDAGIGDKRLLVVESELARTLRVLGREGNVLSAVIRQAWDSGNLRTMTKNPVTATGAHIGIVGHITKEELLRYLDSTEAANGFGNRFLWIAARRSRVLPDGGSFPLSDLNAFTRRLFDALNSARSIGEMRRDTEARDIWHSVYPSLSQGKPGLYGAMTGRAEAYVMRLACIYALMDESNVVKVGHLMAALALWEYVERTVRYVFGDATGDSTADTILRALRTQGRMTLTTISYLFGRNVSAERLANALGLLQEGGYAESRTEETDGRPATTWGAK